ncbi:major facilitator superfamily domain-containing protein [Echria macrotheca]|uniref:Major facilitator superfamily domain-containing protein n=1 Tax=Echria macrotheca TaxID=438768 RepID=A0AAJ0FC81_9PEZI|nr:major facilitator superfamily domain-containing protein [Echria macrotheca]
MLVTITTSISTTFNAFDQLSWLGTTFSIGSSISQPLSGHLTDVFGRRAGLVTCYLVFAIGTLLCGLSATAGRLWVFYAGRILQGLGGGALCSITSFIESDLVPLRKRALIEGVGNVAYGATLALGGIYGGGIDSAIGWRWAFLVQVPVIALDAALVVFVVPVVNSSSPPGSDAESRWARVDYIGCVLILAALVLFQYGMNEGSTSGAWATPRVIAMLVVSGVCFVAFSYWDLCRAANPLIPIRRLAERTIASSQVSFFFNSASSAATMLYLPIFLQACQGLTVQDSGLRFVPHAVAFGLGSFAAGLAVKQLNRYWGVNLGVQAACVAGTAGLCAMTASPETVKAGWPPYVCFVLLGLGYGGAFVTRLVGLLSATDQADQAVIQAASWTISSTGFTVGIAVAAAVFQSLSVDQVTTRLGRDSPGESEKLADALRHGAFEVFFNSTSDSGEDGDEGRALRRDIVGIYTLAVRSVFFLALATIVLSALASLGMRDNTLEPPASTGENGSEDGGSEKGKPGVFGEEKPLEG